MAKLSQIRRLAILINKLSAVRYVPTDALIAHVKNTLALYDNKDSNYSQRTMQRDFGLIDEMFGIVIRNDKSRGYYIAELDEMTDNYKELLLNFELLSSINTDSVLQKYVLAEHRQNAIRHELIAPLLKAIRKRNPIEFDYTLVRHNGKIVHKRLMPHFLNAPHACHNCTTLVSGLIDTQLTTSDASFKKTHRAVAICLRASTQFPRYRR